MSKTGVPHLTPSLPFTRLESRRYYICSPSSTKQSGAFIHKNKQTPGDFASKVRCISGRLPLVKRYKEKGGQQPVTSLKSQDNGTRSTVSARTFACERGCLGVYAARGAPAVGHWLPPSPWRI